MAFIFSWYIILYGMNMLGMFILMARIFDNIKFIDVKFQGLFTVDPIAGLSMVLIIFSIAGLPTSFLFLNKVFLFQAFKNVLGLIFLLVMLSLVISILYYFRFIKSVLFTDTPATA